ncbi:uncharacterized protein [Pocillopora verrucosa]|uniref:uncharacterized protein isoform X2 n=1 Tax=Pocillopora verrucosa TaxID=203993 RepID=UPI0027975188|nr:uncharacterized protein LOC131776554 isoform X2 [Pocillopora verrucosa]
MRMMNLKVFLGIFALNIAAVCSVSSADSCFSYPFHDAILAKVFTSELSDDDVEELIKQDLVKDAGDTEEVVDAFEDTFKKVRDHDLGRGLLANHKTSGRGAINDWNSMHVEKENKYADLSRIQRLQRIQ